MGIGNAPDEFRHFAGREPEPVPECDELSGASQTIYRAHLLGRIFSWGAGHLFVELCAENSGDLRGSVTNFGSSASIVLFTFSRRSGPTVLPPVVSRLAPLEFVDTLGGLYERAGAEPAVVGFVYQRFRATLSRQLRISESVGDTELADAVQSRLGWKESGLKKTLARALGGQPRRGRWRRRKALGLVQELERYEEQLGLKKKIAKEKS